MKKFAYVAAAVAAVLFAPVASAESEWYVSGGYSAFSDEDATLNAITVRGGGFFTENFGAEIEGSFGIGEEEVEGVELELSNQVAIYGVGKLPLAENFDLLGRIGYATGEIEGTVPGFGSASVDVDGFAAGIGGQYFFTENFGIRGDYTRFEADDDELDGGFDIFSISAVYKFG